MSLIFALQIYFPPRLPQAVGLFVVHETSSPEEQEVFGSEEFTAATNSQEPAPGEGVGVGLCVFPGPRGASSWTGLKSWRIPASVSQQRKPHE